MTSETEKESSSLLNNLYRQMCHWRKSLFLECLNSMRMPIQIRLRSIVPREGINEDNSGTKTIIHEEETATHPICSVLVTLPAGIPENTSIIIEMPIPEFSGDSITLKPSLNSTSTLDSSLAISETCDSIKSKSTLQVSCDTDLSLSLFFSLVLTLS